MHSAGLLVLEVGAFHSVEQHTGSNCRCYVTDLHINSTIVEHGRLTARVESIMTGIQVKFRSLSLLVSILTPSHWQPMHCILKVQSITLVMHHLHIDVTTASRFEVSTFSTMLMPCFCPAQGKERAFSRTVVMTAWNPNPSMGYYILNDSFMLFGGDIITPLGACAKPESAPQVRQHNMQAVCECFSTQACMHTSCALQLSNFYFIIFSCGFGACTGCLDSFLFPLGEVSLNAAVIPHI